MTLGLPLFIVLLSLKMCNCAEMKIGQVVKLDLFKFYPLFSSYMTKLQIGSPPKVLNVVIDTGSDLTWVDCSNVKVLPFFVLSDCHNLELIKYLCDNTGNIFMQTRPNFYNLLESRTSKISSCEEGSRCTFDVSYKDGSASSGYYVSDNINFSSFLPNSSPSHFSSRVIFGCSTMRTVNPKVDGILGLGRGKDSLPSQLSAQQVSPEVISHCLAREGGGGYLIMGEVVEVGITYTPLIPSKSLYNVDLESISVNGMQIKSTTSPGNSGTIFDSGTTLTVLVADLYDPLVGAVSAAVNKPIIPGESFPNITLNFAGSASILLMPQDYVQDEGYLCLGFQRDEDISILGDLVLRDKVVVYDQPRERIGLLTRDLLEVHWPQPCPSFVKFIAVVPIRNDSAET
uniref:Peptidase A1 domain-containing protein n=1 Tax=Kalanchoe fedtschenkoi TaxID=63787 RepID=A0A7N0ZVZ9_KALFE